MVSRIYSMQVDGIYRGMQSDLAKTIKIGGKAIGVLLYI